MAALFDMSMITVDYEFSPEQRLAQDRYERLLAVLFPTYDKIPIVFERRGNSGHRRATLPYDSRLNKVSFNRNFLSIYWERCNSIRTRYATIYEDLIVFAHEASQISDRMSPSMPIDQVDVALFSYSRSPVWGASRPVSVRGLIQGLGSELFDAQGYLDVVKSINKSLYEDSFALKSAFIGALDYRSCDCHSQPVVVQELFAAVATTPDWDIAYSSTDPSIRAQEYKADITALFDGFTALRSQMAVFLEEILLHVDGAIDELVQTRNMSTMGQMNSKLELAVLEGEALMKMINHLEAWLRK